MTFLDSSVGEQGQAHAGSVRREDIEVEVEVGDLHKINP